MSGNLPCTPEAAMLFWTHSHKLLMVLELAMLIGFVVLLVRLMWQYQLEYDKKYQGWCKRNGVEEDPVKFHQEFLEGEK